MAIRWSAKGRRFYDDQSGYPVTRERARLSATARRSYRTAHHTRSRRIPDREPPAKKRRRTVEKGYEVRPLSEEFAEELADFDGTTKAQTMNRYADTLADEEPDVYEQEDRYSED